MRRLLLIVGLFIVLVCPLFGQVQLYMFSGPASPVTDTNFNNVVNAGVLTGVVLQINWSAVDIDGNPAHYVWSALDTTLLGPYLTNYPNLKIDLIVAPALDISLLNHANTVTPNYIFLGAANTCFCPTYTGDGRATGCYTDHLDLTGAVPSFDSFFESNYKRFITDLIAHINGSMYASRIGLHVIGYSHGGESNPICSAQMQTLVIPPTTAGLISTWTTMTQSYDAVVAAAAPTFPVAVTLACLGNAKPPTSFSTINNCPLAAAEAASHFANHIGLRGTGLQSADLLETAGNTPSSADWVNMFRTYPSSAVLDLQQSAESNPNGACPTSTAGSFTTLGPFALERWPPPPYTTDIWEVYTAELEGTYSSTFHDNTCWPVGTVTVYPYAPYDAVFRHAIAGQPAGTTGNTGATRRRAQTTSR